MTDSKQLRGPYLTSQLVRQMVGLVLVSIGCGVVANSVGPVRIPWRQEWSNQVGEKAQDLGLQTTSLDEAKQLLDQGMHFIFDARSPADYEAGHLPGAMLLYSEEFDTYFSDYALMLIPEQPVLVYCSGKACDESLLVSEMLYEQGFTNVTVFVGGMEEWLDAGFPTERGL